MLHHPAFDPVAVAIGPLKVHWYGLMYLAAFASAWWLARLRARRPGSPVTEAQVEDLIFWGAIGVVAGGRLGYVLFYGFAHFQGDPLWLFRVWEGGMSFHGLGSASGASVISLARSCGAGLPICHGAWCFRATRSRWRGIPRSSTRPRSRACCCSWCCGGFRRGRARGWQYPGCS